MTRPGVSPHYLVACSFGLVRRGCRRWQPAPGPDQICWLPRQRGAGGQRVASHEGRRIPDLCVSGGITRSSLRGGRNLTTMTITPREKDGAIVTAGSSGHPGLRQRRLRGLSVGSCLRWPVGGRPGFLPVLLTLWTAGSILAQGTPPRADSPGGIAAIVGREVITYGELDRKVDAFIAMRAGDTPINPVVIQQARPRLRRQFIRTLTEQSLLLQEAERLEIRIGKPQIDKRIQDQINELREEGRNIRDEDEFFRLLLENEKITREEYVEELRKEMLVNALLWYKVFQDREFISPGERREYYRAHPEEFQTPSELAFRMILVPRTEQTQRVLEAIDAGLESGVPFRELADRFSALTSRPGGLWVRKFDELKGWYPPLPDYLRKMKPGDIERRILTSTGWCYLKMERIEQGELRSFEEVQEDIETRLLIERRAEDRRRFVEKLKRRIPIQIFVETEEEETDEVAARRDEATDGAEGDPGGRAPAAGGGPAVKDVSPEPAGGAPKDAGEGEPESSEDGKVENPDTPTPRS